MAAINVADAAATISQYRTLLDGAAGKAGGDHVIGKNDLEAIAADPGAPPALKEAAQFFLANPAQLNALDTAQQGGDADTAVGFGDLDTFSAKLPASQFGSPAQARPTDTAGLQQPTADPYLLAALLGGGGPSGGLPPGGLPGGFDPAHLTALLSPDGGAGAPPGMYGQQPTGDLLGLHQLSQADDPITDGFQAAGVLHQNFDAIEATGMDASGAGAGDGNIGMSELKRVADPNSGFPPRVQQAAQFMIDHPTSARAADGPVAAGGAGEAHFSKDDLGNLAAQAQPGGLRPLPSQIPGLSRPLTTLPQQPWLEPRTPPTQGQQPRVLPQTTTPDQPAPPPPMTQRKAVEMMLKSFDTFDQAAGIGERDGFVGKQDLEAIANSPDAPPNDKAAAKFLLSNAASMSSIDTDAEGGVVDQKISKADLQRWLTQNPV